MIALIDYGSGNLHSAFKALEKVGGNVVLATTPEQLESASHIVLPGVGAFADCMQGLQQSGLVECLEEQVLNRKKPFLGICVGMQLLADKGLEHGETQGLGWIPGTVKQFAKTNLKVPHMGWNNITTQQDHPILEGIEQADFYFVHSYHMTMEDNQSLVASCRYGTDFPAIVSKDNITGVQFHPEKSQRAGLQLLANFINSSSFQNDN